jgi:hypothetical protein
MAQNNFFIIGNDVFELFFSYKNYNFFFHSNFDRDWNNNQITIIFSFYFLRKS